MDQTPAVLMWFDNGELRDAVGPVPGSCFDKGIVEVPADVQPGGAAAPLAGRYVPLPDEVSAAVTQRDPFRVFLVDSHRADEVRWMMHFDDRRDEAAVADQVRRQVTEAVELRIRAGARSVSPTLTYLDNEGSPASGYVMHGLCIIATKRD